MQHHPITCKKQNFNINKQNYERSKNRNFNPEIQNSDYLNKHGDEAKELEREREQRE